MNRRHTAALAAYAGAIVAANMLTARAGMWPVLPGLEVTAGTYAAGLALLARDAVQDTAPPGRALRSALAAIAAGALLSLVGAGPGLAVASGAAFLVAELADAAVYTPLRRSGWARAVVASNVVGAILDTLIFLALADFPITALAVSGQMVGKVLWATGVPVGARLLARRWAR